MQIVSIGDNLHEMSNPVFWKNKKKFINMLSAELAQKVVKVKMHLKITIALVEPVHSIPYKIACAPSKDTDQPG